MPGVNITRQEFLQDVEGSTFADVANDPEQPFGVVLEFFSDVDRQRRMVESEARDDRAPFAAVKRELEAQPSIQDFLSSEDPIRRKRLGQVVTVVVRMIMDRLGWEVVPQTVGEGRCPWGEKR